MRNTADERTREILVSLVSHLHAFVRESRLTEAEFRQAGFRLLSHQDFLPGCARMRVYVLRKAS